MSTNHDELGWWARQASCRALDADLFFPENATDEETAKEVCAGCAVREACLEHALTNGEAFGIWGGLNLRERRVLRRTRAVAVGAPQPLRLA
ncbi:MAG: Transcription factor WhiB [Ilumatobacteraceae bacterium]|jgi:WhiB family redox-sensing transcriptional regulator|nr:Transcription factor WhiB [Ilumatobacteraceae bacterium]